MFKLSNTVKYFNFKMFMGKKALNGEGYRDGWSF